MIRIGNTLIIDSDRAHSTDLDGLTGLCPITCGLSARSTVTASSIREDGFTYCIQRTVFSLSGAELSPQEFEIHWRKKPNELYPYLAMITLFLLCDVSVEVFSDLLF